MKYRQDIDGLRAIAVLSVVAFHYKLGRIFSGGYIGVDIFFVISGYLITRIIYDDMLSERYSVIEFYDRRVRRIFPALFLVFAVTLAAAFALRLPSEVSFVGESVVSSIFFVSNIFFHSESGYFSSKLEFNPVLHTWSLSVEEQFYVFFPLLMVAIRPLANNMRRNILIAITILSFIASVINVYIEPTGAFYFVQYRAWELLIGGLVAIEVFPKTSNRVVIETVAISGLAAIIAAVVLYSPYTPFPGLAATLPVCGTAALIYAGGCGSNYVSRLLGFRLFRGIGLISYSLYLWHWPLYVYAQSLVKVEGLTRLALLGVAFVVATASWRFIERPFRQKPYRFNQKQTVAAAFGTMLVATTIALALGPLAEAGWPTPAKATALLAYEEYKADEPMRVGTCFLTSGFNSFSYFKKDECLKLSPDKPNVLIIGDSHAAHLWPGYSAVFASANFLQSTASGCKPIEGTKGEARCVDLIRYIFNDFLPKNHLDAIIISARWEASEVNDAVSTAQFLRKFADRVIISGPIQEYDKALPQILAHAAATEQDMDAAARKHLLPEQKKTDSLFAKAILSDGVTYVSIYSTLCQNDCRLWAADGVPLQFDYGHLTKEGSISLARIVGPPGLGLTR